MWNTTQFAGFFCGFPDVCKTPTLGNIPIPYPNFGTHAQGVNPCPKVLFCIAPVHNKGTKKAMSFGDQLGATGGVLSQVFMSQTSHLANYSNKYKICNKPAVRMTGVEKSNRRNVIVIDIGPSIQPVTRTYG